MKIGIIGAGHIGGTLVEKLAAAGHDVGVANAHGPQTLDARARHLGKNVHAMTVDGAASYGDVVVVSIPFGVYRTRSGGGGPEQDSRRHRELLPAA